MCIITKKIEDLAKKTSIYDLFFNALNWKGERISNLEFDIRYYEDLGIIPSYVTEYVCRTTDDSCADDVYPALLIEKGA
jgi:hypothetical protein